LDRTSPGFVTFHDTRRRVRTGYVTVGALPDMLAFSHDGSKLLVANEGTPDVYGARVGASVPWIFAAPAVDPVGSVSVIDVATRTVLATPGFAGVPTFGSFLRTTTGMDFEPEYIAIDPLDNNVVDFISPAAQGLYMPDGIATYKWRGQTLLVMANEGDFREDDADRLAASTLSATAPLNRLRVSATESAPGDLYAAGARTFSVRDESGNLVYDSGDILDKEANRCGIYNDGRSRDKGVEPEGVALHDIGGRTYAFVGLERTSKSAVAVFDITDPFDVAFVDMIVGEVDVSPEGIAVFRHRGDDYLAVAHEVSITTTLYRIDRARRAANR